MLIHMWDRAKSFVKKAGTIIFLACGLVWFLSSFSFRFELVEDAGDSMLAVMGGAIAPLFSPLGWGDWRSAVATLTGLVAKENVVGTFGILYGFGDAAGEGALWTALQSAMLPLAAYSFLVFNLLCAPCFAAIGAIRREMMSARWTLLALGYQTLLAYGASLVIYQLGMLFGQGHFGIGTVAALGLLAAFIWLLVRPAAGKTKGRNVLSPQF